MNRSFRFSLALLMAAHFVAPAARAAINIPPSRISAFFTGIDQGSSAPGAPGTLGLNGQMAYGVGILYGVALGTHFELEVGYIGSVYSPAGTPTYFMETPVLLRWNLDKHVSLGVGGYGLDTVHVGWGAGAEGSLRLSLPTGEKFAFFLEGRYRYGLIAIDQPAGTKFYDAAFETMLGLSYKL